MNPDNPNLRDDESWQKHYDSLVAENAALKEKLDMASEALKFYAAYPDNEFKTKWQNHVCDSWSGQTDTFDWDGALQDEPFEIAREALQKIGEHQKSVEVVENEGNMSQSKTTKNT